MAEKYDLLPLDYGLDIGALSRMFDDTTTSYKYLFFAALLEEFKCGGYTQRVFSLSSLALGMLSAAWHPVRVYRLSLGARDQTTLLLKDIEFGGDGPIPARKLKDALALAKLDCRSLVRWVPFRLISPFFFHELRGIGDNEKNSLIRLLADKHFYAKRPLYRFASHEEIELHPDWTEYLAKNFPIVMAWSERRWISYLQARNPAVPAISEKIGPLLQRNSLASQTRYWKRVIAAMDEPPHCIYSGLPIEPDRFHLDHFLPWTFVCHDSLWNLLPVSPKANSSKGNRLPHPTYVQDLAKAQHTGLVTANRIMTGREWETASNSFIGELRIPETSLLDASTITESYERFVGSQLDIARGIGFESCWRYQA